MPSLSLFSCTVIFLPNCSKYGCNFFLKQPTNCTSASDCKLLIAPISLKPTPVTAALLEVEVVWLFNIRGAKSNEQQNLRLPYKLVDVCVHLHGIWFSVCTCRCLLRVLLQENAFPQRLQGTASPCCSACRLRDWFVVYMAGHCNKMMQGISGWSYSPAKLLD